MHFYVYEDDPDGEMEMMRALYSMQAEVTPKWEEPPLTWKEVSFKTSVQDPVKGLIEAKTVDISMKVPNRWVLNDEHGVIDLGDFHYGDGTKAADGLRTQPLRGRRNAGECFRREPAFSDEDSGGGFADNGNCQRTGGIC